MQNTVEVLAVDASADALADIRASVEPLGANLREASSGEEALRSLLHDPEVAAIVMDVRLPGMDGLETALAIRRRHKTRHVPIIVVADADGPDRSRDAYQALVADYIAKPVDRAALRAKLAALIDLQLLRGQSDAPTQRALHDGLTGLPNRELFRDRLEQALARAARRPVPLALLLVDLAGFTQVNDQRGPEAGDDVLAEAARRVRALVRTGDTVARYGGDEFTILAEDVGDADAARELGERVAAELARPYADGVVLSAAVGAAFIANPARTTADGLIRRADHAMHRSKRPGARPAEVSRVQPGLLAGRAS